MTNDLLERRRQTLGSHAPLFYARPLELVRGDGVWVWDADGNRYLDAYNNVPHVGHCHPRVVDAVTAQASTLNLHTRYLNTRVVDYAEALLGTFDAGLDRVLFVNSGSEANDLAFRIATQHTGSRGVLVSDFSYHGNTSYLAGLTTGLTAYEGLADYVRAVRIPDLDTASVAEERVLAEALADVDAAIASLEEHGHGVAAVLIDPLFSTEGLNRIPAGYIEGVTTRVHAAGGLVIGDEVQSGFGRTGTHMWGHQRLGMRPELVTLGKPMGNGHPLGAVVTSAALLDEFGPRNMYFNTFGGNPVSSAAGHAVLDVMTEEGLQHRALTTGLTVSRALKELVAGHPLLGPVKGTGLFFGFGVFGDGAHQQPDAAATKRLVEEMRAAHVMISRIGPHDNVLKMRPPLAFGPEHVDLLLESLEGAIDRALQR
ncbi:aspartate aminotransferase family protein [Agromyces bauzanensis]